MKALLENFFAGQTPSPGSSEGLPYWIFWLLLFVILLLLVFIFLRDKNLRRRINLFLFGAKKKLMKIRLQARLKREFRKKDNMFRNLGKKAWEDQVKIPKGGKTEQELDNLEENRQELEREFNDTLEKISGLETDHEKFIQKHKSSLAEQESVKKSYHKKMTEIKDEVRVLEVKVTEKQKELEGLVRGIHSSGNEITEKIEELQNKREKLVLVIKKLV